MDFSTITVGTKLIQKAHPEYGIWTVTAIDVEDLEAELGWFEIRGRSGDTVLFFGELKFWQAA